MIMSFDVAIIMSQLQVHREKDEHAFSLGLTAFFGVLRVVFV